MVISTVRFFCPSSTFSTVCTACLLLGIQPTCYDKEVCSDEIGCFPLGLSPLDRRWKSLAGDKSTNSISPFSWGIVGAAAVSLWTVGDRV